MTRSVLYVLFCWTMVIPFSNLEAQEQLPESQKEIIKDFKARINEARRLKMAPVIIRPTQSSTPLIVDSVSLFPVEITYPAPQLRPLAAQVQKNPEGKNGFVSFGIGTPNMLSADLGYVYDNDNFYLGIDGGYLNAESNKNKLQSIRFIDTEIFGGVRISNTTTVGGNIYYREDRRGLYKEIDTLDIEINTRKLKYVGGHVELFNHDKNSLSLDYNVKLKVDNVQDNLGSKEDNILIKADATKWFGNNHSVTVFANSDFTSYKNEDTRELTNSLVGGNYAIRYNDFSLEAGANFVFSKNESHFFPIIEAKGRVFKDYLIVYGKVDGNLKKSNFRSLSLYNPYIDSQLDTLLNTKSNSYTVGLQGSTPKFSYDLAVRYEKLKNAVLYIPAQENPLLFSPLFDELKQYGLSLGLGWTISDQYGLAVRFEQLIIDPTTKEKAWGIPTTLLEISGVIKYFEDRLNIEPSISFEDGIYSLDSDMLTSVKLDPLYDFSIHASFKLNKTFSLFIDANNLLNNKRERWDGYDSFGINGVGGILVRF